MQPSAREITDRLDARFGGMVALTVSGEGPRARVIADRKHLLPVLDCLRNDAELAFDELTDLTAVDCLHLAASDLEGARFAVVYQLYSMVHGHRFRLATRVPEDDLIVPSAAGLWPSARWAEREVLDLFGIEFDDHPDPRRLLLPEDYPGYPLRKDEPAAGSARRVRFLESVRRRMEVAPVSRAASAS